jgi:hypothetical protein
VKGHLLLLRPIGVVSTTTKYGETAAIHLDMVDLTTGEIHLGVIMYPKLIISALRERVGGPPVLATVPQGKALEGQKPPWLLTDRTRDRTAVATAERFAEAHPEFFA